MVPHSYATDAQSKSVDLAATVAAAFSSPQIASACTAVESFLRKHSSDQQRWFFSITFPTLICRVFGFDDPSPPSTTTKRHPSNGWIDVACSENNSELAGKIFSLLSPNGVLLTSISEIDRMSLVKYVYPTERLPEWVRHMLRSAHDCKALTELCPLFKRRIKEDLTKGSSFLVQLNIFEYYLFWFAYYPVSRGNSEGSETVKVQRTKRFRLENWSYSIPGLSSAKRETDKKTEGNLYLRLLYVYLHTFVPLQDLSMHQPYGNSLLHYAPAYDSSTMERSEFVVYTLIHFWLVDNDFSPLSVGLLKAFGVIFPFKLVLEEIPPTPGLGDVIDVVIRYLNLSLPQTIEGPSQIEYLGGSESFGISSKAFLVNPSGGSWNLLIQRPLYRYILRTFLFCPVETSTKNAFQAFSVWVNYMEPWSVSFEEFTDINESLGLAARTSMNIATKSSSAGYTSSWQQFILSNYLFYSSLVMHFIGFAHKFLHTDAELMLKMVAKVMNILTSSIELKDLIKNVDMTFHSKASESYKSPLGSLNKYIPTIRQQLQCFYLVKLLELNISNDAMHIGSQRKRPLCMITRDWEGGLCESDADGSFLHENWNKDLQLFSSGEDGGQQLLQLLLLRAESELQSVSVNNLSQNLQILDSLKGQLSLLFGGPFVTSSSEMPQAKHQQEQRDELFKPRSFHNQKRSGIKYNGNWMKWPVFRDEMAWLMPFVASVSSWTSEKLGLNRVNFGGACRGWSYAQLHSGMRSFMVTLKVIFLWVFSWIMALGDAGIRFMRTHGYRVRYSLRR